MKKIVVFTLLIWSVCAIRAQEITITASIDSAQIVLGNHQKLHLSVTAPNHQKVTIQSPEQWQLSNCEIITVKPQTARIEGKIAHYEQEATLISFDTGVATIAPIFIFQNDTTIVGQTKPLQFIVDSFPVFVDTNLAFKDIKLPVNGNDIELLPDESNSANWKKILSILLLVLLGIGTIIYLYLKFGRKYLQNKRLAEAKQKRKENAGMVALNNLKLLKTKKLWQKGQVKEYYSELSMIVRIYIDNQWNINAQEMVTDEIMEAVDILDIEYEQLHELHTLLSRADLVKYAKEQPVIEENEVSYKKACAFVKTTDAAERAKQTEQLESTKRK